MDANLPEGFEIIEEPSVEAIPTEEAAGSAELPEGFVVAEEAPLSEKILAGGEAFAEGLLSRPVIAAAQKYLGVKPEEAEFRKESIGALAPTLEVAGLAAPAIATVGGSLATRAGLTGLASIATKAAALEPFTQAGVLSTLGKGAAKAIGAESAIAKAATTLGVENAIFAAANETAKAIEGKPETINQAIWNIGLSGAIGAGIGAPLGKAGELWKTKYGPTLKQSAKDFSSRLKDIKSGAIPTAETVGKELEMVASSADDIGDALVSPKGVKRAEIESLLPKEATEAIAQKESQILSDVDEVLDKAKKMPANFGGRKMARVEESAIDLSLKLNDPNLTPYDRYVLLDDFKKVLGKERRWHLEEEGAAKEIGKLYHKLRNHLEDEAVWGLAGKRQAQINAAYSEWRNNLKAFRKAVMTEVRPKEYVINPDKLQTVVNQIQKGKGAVKQDILSNFLDSTEELFNVSEKVNSKLGITQTAERPAMTASRALTEKLTPGMKAADYVYGQAINAASELGGMEIGYKVGKMSGVPGAQWFGAMFGHHTIKPILKNVMPVLIKPLMEIGGSASGIRATSEAVTAIINGENMSKVAADAIFSSKPTIPFAQFASNDKLDRLDEQVRKIAKEPTAMLDMHEDMGHYLPMHSGALAQISMNAIQYLNTQRPEPKQNGMLDNPIPPSPAKKAAYMRTLQIAQNPLIIMQRIKDGTLRSKDVTDFKNMYPDLYNDAVQKVTNAMVNHMAKKQPVPFGVKKALSLLAGQPLDSNFSPSSIQAAQATYANQMPQQQPLPQMAKKSTRKSQLPEQTQTDQQRRMISR